MGSSWDIGATLIDIAPLSDLLGERHRIIANDSAGSVHDDERRRRSFHTRVAQLVATRAD